MKSIHILAAVAITASVTMGGCYGALPPDPYGCDTAQMVTVDDSLSYYWGRQLGLSASCAYNQLDSAAAAEISIDAYFTGAADVFSADHESSELMQGLATGLLMANQLDLLEASGIEVDRQYAKEQFHSSLMREHPDSVEAAGIEAAYTRLMGRAQTRILGRLKQQRIQQNKMMKKIRTDNMARSAEFLDNLLASDSTIEVVDSTLCYRVVREGDGPMPGEHDVIRFRYTLRDFSGSVIDSNTDDWVEGPLADVQVGALRDGIEMMPVGSHYVFYITNAGTRSALAAVQPGRLIIADIELLQSSPKK
ncbi:MAG: hypothetical protein K2K79_05615 [Paramuribaculum sp.]|nr:hypothetical protein [Paramuribaculum sp.]